MSNVPETNESKANKHHAPSKKPHGVIGIVGPPGVGKTTTAEGLCRYFRDNEIEASVHPLRSFYHSIAKIITPGLSVGLPDTVMMLNGARAEVNGAQMVEYIQKWIDEVCGIGHFARQSLLNKERKDVTILVGVLHDVELKLCDVVVELDRPGFAWASNMPNPDLVDVKHRLVGMHYSYLGLVLSDIMNSKAEEKSKGLPT